MTVPQLRAELEKLGAQSSGLKPELIERLQSLQEGTHEAQTLLLFNINFDMT